MKHSHRLAITIAVVAAALNLGVGPASAADGRNGALLGGLAVGAVGGVLLGQALRPGQPDYVEPPPAPIDDEPAPVYMAPPRDPYLTRLERLHAGCDQGSRRACIKFGEMIGEHKERVAEWRRSDPAMFDMDGY